MRREVGDAGRRKGSKTERAELNSEEVEEAELKDENSDADDHECGKRAPKRVADPKMPTQAEIDEHNLTHMPYRSWCIHCVRGRAETSGHRRQGPRPEGAVPEVHMDYCFMGKKDEEAQPILVARDRDTRMTVSFLVQSKGVVSNYTVKRLMAFLREIGHHGNNIIIRSDQESPIKAVAERLAKERGEAQTLLENSPVRSSGSNGIVERAIKEIEYHVKSLKSALDERLGTSIGAASNILAWLIEFSGVEMVATR